MACRSWRRLSFEDGVQDPNDITRWEKQKKGEKCFITGCSESFFTSTKNTISNKCLCDLGVDITTDVPLPTPLCKHHYFLIKNREINTQTSCPTCNVSLRSTTVKKIKYELRSLNQCYTSILLVHDHNCARKYNLMRVYDFRIRWRIDWSWRRELARDLILIFYSN